jgi:hypothetical protein
MDGDDMDGIGGVVIGHRNIERPVRFNHRHHQAFWKWLCCRVLFEDLAFLEYALGLLAVNAPFSKPEEGVVAPFDAARGTWQ